MKEGTMRALMYLGIGELAMRDLPLPGDEILVRVSGCGICGTDLKTYRVGHHLFTPPTILGHEFYGRVERAPVDSGYREGDLVVVAPYCECGSCAFCSSGSPSLCRDKSYVSQGAFCEYVGLPASYAAKGLFRLPAEDDVYTLVEPLACVLNGVERLRLHSSSRVLVVGSGPMGALFALLFKAKGIRVAVVEPSASRRGRASPPGGVEAHEPGAAGIGAYDNVVIAVNKAALFDEYIRSVSDGGTVLMFSGLPKGESVSVDSYSIHYREVRLAGSSGYAIRHFREALELIQANKESFARLITHKLPLEGGKERLRAPRLRRGLQDRPETVEGRTWSRPFCFPREPGGRRAS